MTAPAYDAVLFISFGGPEKSDDVMPFLEVVTKGRGIPRERLLDVAHHYEQIGGASPINEITRRQAEALERELRAQNNPLKVYVGQRNWHPFVEETLRAMAADGVRRAVGFITAAHRTEASLDRYIQSVDQARERIGPSAPVIDYVDPWFDHPLFVEAISQRIREVLQSTAAATMLMNIPWLFVAHSIPCAMAQDSSYVQDLERTAGLVCESFGKKDWRLAYSSRSGNPRDPWLLPDINDAIRAEAARGIGAVLLVTIGFLADHVEVLFDQDIEARETAQQEGLRFHRTATVGDHPQFVRMMASVVTRRMTSGDAPEQRRSVRPLDVRCFCFPESAAPPCKRPAAAL